MPGLDHAITASLGVATFPKDANDATALIRHADRALYAAKKGGRNRVEAFARATALTTTKGSLLSVNQRGLTGETHD